MRKGLYTNIPKTFRISLPSKPPQGLQSLWQLKSNGRTSFARPSSQLLIAKAEAEVSVCHRHLLPEAVKQRPLTSHPFSLAVGWVIEQVKGTGQVLGNKTRTCDSHKLIQRKILGAKHGSLPAAKRQSAASPST